MGNSWISGGTILFSLTYVGGILLFFVSSIYFLIAAVKFMKQKTEHDREMIRKLDELIQLSEKGDLTPKEKYGI